MRFRFCLALIMFFGISNKSLAQMHVTHTETTGNYSGIFFIHETRSFALQHSEQTGDIDANGLLLSIMYPGRSFGFGLEMPYITKNIKISGPSASSQYQNSGWGDISLVAKYQFGIYEKFKFIGKYRLFKAIVGALARLKLPTTANNLRDANGKLMPTPFQLGSESSDLTLGLVFHSDTKKYFWLHGHFASTFPISYREFKPGTSHLYNLTFMFADLGINDTFYPFLGFKGGWSGNDYREGQKITRSNGHHLFLSLGLKSIWWYFAGQRVQTELAVQLPVIKQSALTPSLIPSGIYLGSRIYFR